MRDACLSCRRRSLHPPGSRLTADLTTVEEDPTGEQESISPGQPHPPAQNGDKLLLPDVLGEWRPGSFYIPELITNFSTPCCSGQCLTSFALRVLSRLSSLAPLASQGILFLRSRRTPTVRVRCEYDFSCSTETRSVPYKVACPCTSCFFLDCFEM